MKQFLKEFVHNVIVHPLMMVLPTDKACKLHDKNADWTFKKYENIIENKDSKIIDQLYLNWINKEFHNPENFFIKPTAAGYYLHSTTLNKVYKTTAENRQLLNDSQVKILHSFRILQENL